MELIDLYKKILSSFVIIFYGDFGEGKTLSATYLNMLSALIQKSKAIIGNNPYFYMDSQFGIEFIPLVSTSQLDDTASIANTIISMDEIQNIANSRDSMSPRNSFVNNFTTNLRKVNVSIRGTTHYTNTIDYRLYNETQCMIAPQMKDKQNLILSWSVILKRGNEVVDIPELNLSQFTQFYDTNFIPYEVVVNHEEYIDHLKATKSVRWVDDYIYRCDKKIKNTELAFKESLRGKI